MMSSKMNTYSVASKFQLIVGKSVGAMLYLLLFLVVAPVHADEEQDSCQALFVQSAAGMSWSGDQLTLKDANPVITWFCDRPVRQAGHLDINTFLEQVSQGENSFAENPPNAALSVFNAGTEQAAAVITLLHKPRIVGSDLVYTIALLEGSIPKSGGQVVLFIDPIGRPLSPTSVAGVRRRHLRRAAILN